jgi:hypothetical protein
MKNQNIGGFFELEIPKSNKHSFHPEAHALTSGRSCFNLILTTIRPVSIYIPYYICDAALTPLTNTEINIKYYELDESLLPRDLPALQDHEYFLYVNYFGIMNNVIDKLYYIYGKHLIIDNTQAFFERKYKDCWSFNSARKFFGVPDGAYLYGDESVNVDLTINDNPQYNHLIERLIGSQTSYHSYLESEKKVTHEIQAMSPLTDKLLSTINYNDVIDRRVANYKYYANELRNLNTLTIEKKGNSVPFCYPLLIKQSLPREDLAKRGIYLPTYWKEVANKNLNPDAVEIKMSQALLPLPIDHRYTDQDCQRVIDNIHQLIKE